MKQVKLFWLALIALGLSLQIACDDSDTSTTETAGTTAGTPAGSTAGSTAGTPAGSEGGTPAGSTAGTPAGSTAGTPAGSEGGTPAGSTAGTPAGSEGGTPAGSIPTGGDTAALSCTGDYCPSSRLSALTLPANADSADTLGCNLEGVNAGASLSRLLVAVKDLVQLPFEIQVDASGQVTQDITLDSYVDASAGEPTVLLLAQLAGWAAGKTGNEQGTADLNFFIGQAGTAANSYLINPASLDADGKPLVSFAGASVANSALTTQPGRFTLSLPIMGIPLSFALEQAQLKAALSIDATGFNSETGLIGGYFTKDSLVGLVDGISAACAGPSAPDFCAQAGAFLNVATIESVLGLAAVGGVDGTAYDVKVVDGVASACSGADCNALSICLKVGMASTTIEGVGAAQ